MVNKVAANVHFKRKHYNIKLQHSPQKQITHILPRKRSRHRSPSKIYQATILVIHIQAKNKEIADIPNERFIHTFTPSPSKRYLHRSVKLLIRPANSKKKSCRCSNDKSSERHDRKCVWMAKKINDKIDHYGYEQIITRNH